MISCDAEIKVCTELCGLFSGDRLDNMILIASSETNGRSISLAEQHQENKRSRHSNPVDRVFAGQRRVIRARWSSRKKSVVCVK